MDASAIIGSLNTLSPTDLKKVVAMAQRKLRSEDRPTEGGQEDLSEAEKQAMYALQSVLRDHGTPVSIQAIMGMKGFPAFRHAVTKNEEWFSAYCPDISPAKRRWIWTITARYVITKILSERPFFNMNEVLRRLDALPEAIEQAFPGYAESGLLPVAITRKPFA